MTRTSVHSPSRSRNKMLAALEISNHKPFHFPSGNHCSNFYHFPLVHRSDNGFFTISMDTFNVNSYQAYIGPPSLPRLLEAHHSPQLFALCQPSQIGTLCLGLLVGERELSFFVGCFVDGEGRHKELSAGKVASEHLPLISLRSLPR